MRDYDELKRLALAAIQPNGNLDGDWFMRSVKKTSEFREAACPRAILELLAELERAKAVVKESLIAAPPAGEMPELPFWDWLRKAYRDGDKGDGFKFTKWNMELAFTAGRQYAAQQAKGDAEDVETLIPVGWMLSSVDASLKAHGRSETISIMLVKDKSGRDAWHALSDEEQESAPLYWSAAGHTIRDAISIAAQGINAARALSQTKDKP